MVTIFICKDDAVSKEITQKYLDRESLAYVNMVEGVTYEQAVKCVETLEKGTEEEDGNPVVKNLEDDGWTATGIQEECLKPSEDELVVWIGYERTEGDFKQWASDVVSVHPKKLKAYIDARGLKMMGEKEFYKKYQKPL